MFPLAPTPEPIRVIVESSAGGTWAIWGPLLGVVVGAILAVAGQMLTGRQQRAHERDRDLIAVKRELYARVLREFATLESAVFEAAFYSAARDDASALAAEKRIDAATDALHIVISEVAVSGGQTVYDACLEIFRLGAQMKAADDDGRWRAFAVGLRGHRPELLAVMRADLRMPDDAAADSLRTRAVRRLADLRGRGKGAS